MFIPDIALSAPAPSTAMPPKDPGFSSGSAADSDFQNLLNQKTQDVTEGKQPVPSSPAKDTASDTELLPQELVAALLLPPVLPLDLQNMMKSTTPVIPQTAAPTETMVPVTAQPEIPTAPTSQQVTQTTQNAPLFATAQQAAAQSAQPQQTTATQQQVPAPQQVATQAVVAPQNAASQDAQLLSQEQGDSSNTSSFEQAEAPVKPLFQNTEHVPVKVGDASTLDTQSPDFEAQLGRQINKALQSGEQKLSISLSPDRLGNMVVELTRSPDGALQVLLRTSTAAAANLLNDHSMELSAMLRNNTQAPVLVEVQHPQENNAYQQQQQQNQHGQQQQGQQQQQQQQGKQQIQDFIEQLRLGMLPADAEAV